MSDQLGLALVLTQQAPVMVLRTSSPLGWWYERDMKSQYPCTYLPWPCPDRGFHYSYLALFRCWKGHARRGWTYKDSRPVPNVKINLSPGITASTIARCPAFLGCRKITLLLVWPSGHSHQAPATTGETEKAHGKLLPAGESGPHHQVPASESPPARSYLVFKLLHHVISHSRHRSSSKTRAQHC